MSELSPFDSRVNQNAFIIIDKKTNKLKTISSLGGRLCFWLKAKCSTKQKINARNRQIESMVHTHLAKRKNWGLQTDAHFSQKKNQPIRVRDLLLVTKTVTKHSTASKGKGKPKFFLQRLFNKKKQLKKT